MNEILLDPSSLMYEFLRADVVARLLQEHVNGQHDHHKILFSLVVFEQWLREQPAPSTAAARRSNLHVPAQTVLAS